VAARSSLAAIGTDTAGSVRIPAALSGCVGLKPTHGWMPLAGVHPLAPTLDVMGLLTRSGRDARVLYRSLVGGRPDTTTTVHKVAFIDDPLETMDPSVSAGVDWARQRLQGAGLQVEQVVLPPVAERAAALLTWVRAEAEQVHRTAFASSRQGYGDELAALLELGPVPESELRAAQQVVQDSVRAMRDALHDRAALVGATVPVPAPLIGELEIAYDGAVTHIELVLTRLTSVANAAGLPALSVPAPSAGLPVGVQLIGRPHREEELFALAELLEGAG
jgi:aspartyl-tRNA(Asn)/glutamyl-tRNA(Gln) amidotransferase subunit A